MPSFRVSIFGFRISGRSPAIGFVFSKAPHRNWPSFHFSILPFYFYPVYLISWFAVLCLMLFCLMPCLSWLFSFYLYPVYLVIGVWWFLFSVNHAQKARLYNWSNMHELTRMNTKLKPRINADERRFCSPLSGDKELLHLDFAERPWTQQTDNLTKLAQTNRKNA